MADPSKPLQLPLEPRSVAVFAPSPVLTVTIEAGVEDPEIHLHAGGQGVWVARMAAHLGAEVSLCVPLGGETGQVLKSLLAADRITVLAVEVGGANGAYVHDRRQGRRDEIAKTSSSELHRHELDDLYGVALTAGLEAGAMLLTGPRHEGVLPPETYERLCRDLRRNGRFALADLSGESMRAALRGGVDLLKVSDQELIDAGSLEGTDMSATIAAAHGVRDEGAANVLITRGAKPAVALVDEHLLEVSGPRFTSLDEHGAGDSLFAGLGVALASGLSIEDALRVGVAAGALNVTRHGLGTGHSREISRLAAQVRISPLAPDQSRREPAEKGSAASTAS
jgi:1-phosphofructokinase